jgi:hypothetical protein
MALLEKAVPVVPEVCVGEEGHPAPLIPARSDPQWTPYILSLLTPEEMVNGKPKVGGLERLSLQIIGPILVDEGKVIHSHYQKGWSFAVCEHTVIFQTADGEQRRYTGVGDCSPDNLTDVRFNVYPAATADTRARGRAFRAALNLRGVVTAEECGAIELPEQPADGRITETQVFFLNSLCQRNNINVRKYLATWEEIKGKALKEIPFKVAEAITMELTDLQNDQTRIEASLKGYDANWRRFI